jgi:RecA-family ATPase
VLFKCHAGCTAGEIAAALGLTMKDLFVDKPPDRPQIVATYDYRDDAGNLLAQKLRYSDKHFSWRRSVGGGKWEYNRKGIPHRLYIAGELGGLVHICEGEKDADNFHGKIGGCAVSGADGAGPGKWRKEYTEQLRDRSVVILCDNDDIGRAYAQETAAALHGAAKSVRVLNLSKIWPEIPEHGDVSDLIAAKGPAEAAQLLVKLERETPEWVPGAAEPDPLLSLFKSLEDFPEEDAKWLVQGWIPEGQISIIAADGGIGKTTLWCHVIAALSNGTACILDPQGTNREPVKVMFLTTEDSVRKKLRKKLRLAGANMKNIITPDFVGDRSGLLHKLKFGTPDMEKVLRAFRPALCIFDPVQGFTPPKVNMGSRNEMRDCMAPLISIGEEINTTALIVSHTNKRKGAYGRDRIADSADLWDIARSVMMAGYTEDQGIRYLSNEKNNYSQLQETILFTIDSDGQIQKEGVSWKRDREYIQGAEIARAAPVREDCKAFILQTLEAAGGAMPTAELEEKVKTAGYTFASMKRAKKELKAEGAIKHFQTGSAKSGDKTWHMQLVNPEGFVEVQEDEPTPFDGPVPV